MRILVLGAGAVGGYFGGRLAEAGRDVTFLVRAPRAAALAEHGLKVASALGDFQVPVKVATADRVGGPYDLVILTAKHYDLDAAIEAIRPGVGPETAVLPLAQRPRASRPARRGFRPGAGCSGVSPMSARCCCPTARSATSTACPASPLASGSGGDQRADQGHRAAIRGTPRSAAPANDNILQEMWEKFVMMGAMAGMNCLMRGTVGDIVATEEGERLMVEAIAECRRFAEAAGFQPRPQAGTGCRRC